MKIEKDILYGNDEKCKFDAYLPPADGFTTVVYFHGGGLVSGDKADEPTTAFAKAFAEAGYIFLSVNYHMYTDGAKFPEFLEDGAQAIAFAKKNYADKLGNGKIVVCGQSAGAWMSAMLCLNKQYLSDVGLDAEKIDAWLIDSAQMTSHFNVLNRETGENPWVQRIDEYAPLHYVGEGVKVAPMFLTFYENDMLCRVEQNQLFVKTLQYFHPQADITAVLLPGSHCRGTSQREENGQYAFLTHVLPWLKERSL